MAGPYVTISTPPIITTVVTSATNATTTSTTDVQMTGMTSTPIAGTYFITFSAGVQQNISGDTITVSIYSNGVIDTASTRVSAPFAGGTLTAGQGSCIYATQGIVTVNGSQAIEIRWHVSGGTGTVFNRSMILLKIG